LNAWGVGMDRLVLAALLMVLAPGTEASGEEWDTVATAPVLIKSRSVPGSDIREIWAEGEVAAPVQDVQATLTDVDRFPDFMPYVKESRTIGKPGPDGVQYTYTRLEFGPWVSSRDYVLKVRVERSVGSDGTGDFRNRWVSDPDRIPSRANIIRLRVNQGSWHVVSSGPNKSFAVYRFVVDPGGWIPAFAANAGNKQGVTETFKAIELEAQRRAVARRKESESARR
jgi:hypothetical protein